MNIHKTLISTILLHLLATGTVYGSSIYDEFRSELFTRFESIKQSKGLLDHGAIYTSEVIDRTWYLQRNQLLYEVGEDMLAFLQDNDKAFRQFSFMDWVKATNDLFAVGNWLSEDVGWGNLVIKIAAVTRY